MSLYLGIDTSNYTTSLALYDDATKQMFRRQKLLPVKKGELGLRQSDAVYHHTAALHNLFCDLVKDIDTSQIVCIGASSRPRPVEGSYMPCFLVGLNSAKILAAALKIPMYEFSHQEGHISAALFSAKKDELFNRDFIAFHVSGGTTEAVFAKGYGSGFSIEMCAKSLDLHAGQAVDRIGLMLGLDFPCGAQLESLALNNTEKIKVRPTLKGCNCCLSGVENQCKKLFEQNRSREYIAAYCIEYIRCSLEAMTDELVKKFGQLPLLYAGGVMSNTIIKNSFTKKYKAVFAQPSFSTDNAAGTAYLAYRKFNNV